MNNKHKEDQKYLTKSELITILAEKDKVLKKRLGLNFNIFTPVVEYNGVYLFELADASGRIIVLYEADYNWQCRFRYPDDETWSKWFSLDLLI